MNEFIIKDGIELPFIASRQNARVIRASVLSDKKYRERAGAFLCEGIKLTEEAIRYGLVTDIFICEGSIDSSARIEGIAFAAQQKGLNVCVLSESAFSKISTERSPQGIISIAKFPHTYRELSSSEVLCAADPDKLALILDSIRDPGNLGTILRSALAFGAGTIILYKCADVYCTKTVRAAMGALFKADIIYAQDLCSTINTLKKSGRRILAAALNKSSMRLGEYEKKAVDCIVIGNEGHGVSEEIINVCSDCLYIPIEETTESLNAASAASIILWEYFRQFRPGI